MSIPSPEHKGFDKAGHLRQRRGFAGVGRVGARVPLRVIEIDEESARARGVTRVLSKPFTVQKVSSLIAELQGQAKAA